MPRTSSDVKRLAQQTKILSDNSLLNNVANIPTDPSELGFRCPYCSQSLPTKAGCSHHIVFTKECFKAHEAFMKAKRAERRAREKESLDEDGQTEPQPEPGAEQDGKAGANEPWDYGEGTSAQGALGQWATAYKPAPTPPPTPAPPTHEQLPDGTTLEFFPYAEAGSLISDEQRPETSPDAYLKSCGRLSDPDYFEIAELLMTTGMSNEGRNRMLKSKLYKGKTPWKNCGQMIDNIDKLPSGAKRTIRMVVTPCNGHSHTNYVFARNILEVIR
ncbi:hypothetical protein FRC12_013885 [Ceratobasidium sp. 428]|nr:hypothetical protein FRC12_013885 [Ceratobasidium sp. 428]